MSDHERLIALAEALGIASGYHDIWGNWHPLGEQAARRLVAALGVEAGAADAVDRALAARARAPWARPLPTVRVLRDGDDSTVSIAVPESAWRDPLGWTIRTEDGRRLTGAIDPHELPVLEEVTLDATRWRRLGWSPPPLDHGYHDLVVAGATCRLIVCPRDCQPVPAGPDGGRLLGIAIQLYALRSARNWGVGDLGDLAAVVDHLAPLGVDLVGLNPLHALVPSEPERASPYSPSSRRFLNPIYIDVEAVEDFADCAAAREAVAEPAFQARLEALRAAPLVDYPGVARAKWAVLEMLHAHFARHHLSPPTARGAAFRRFQADGGAGLRHQAVYEVLRARHPGGGWPGELDDPRSPAVAELAATHAVEVELREYLQWQATLQLERVAERARAHAMSLGLYRDLAVGSDGGGADVWAEREVFARGVSIGAPPDDFALQGQVWGLPPWSPTALRERAYQPWVDVLRAGMHASGALRIDHVVGLMRQFWVPDGGRAVDGAYVAFPVEDLLGVLALESRRAGCVVVGEDLGTVPDAMRAALHDWGVLSYRVLYFEKRWHADHTFRAPDEYPEQALVTVSTHDLPTFAGWWTGRDLELREALSLFPSPDTRDRQRTERGWDRDRLLHALDVEDLRPGALERADGTPSAELVDAVHRYAARTRARIMMVQMEDVLGEREQANVPGTVTEQPNWRRKLSAPVEHWGETALARLVAAVRAERNRG